MKKALTIALVLVLAVSLALTACSGSSGTSDSTASGKKLNVALVVGANFGDKSFNDSALAGLKLAQEDLGITYNTTECGGTYTKAEPAMRDYAEGGEYDLIISSSTSLRTYCEQAATNFPDQKFMMFDVVPQIESRDNIYACTYKQNEGSYLTGMIAAKFSQTGVIGTLGGDDIEVINDFFVGYIEGAQAMNPAIKIACSYIGNWTDIAKAKELSLAQIQQKADVIFNVAGSAGEGIFQAALDKGTWGIGVDSDQYTKYAEKDIKLAERIITSMLKRVDLSLQRAIGMLDKGTLPFGKDEALGIKESGVGLAENEYYLKTVSKEIRDDVEAKKQEIIAGKVAIGTAYGQTADWMKNLRDSVKP